MELSEDGKIVPASRAPETPTTQTAALSVSDFTQIIKYTLEANLRPTWVRGELSNLRRQSSGHLYFTLKDSSAQLSAVLFRGDANRQAINLRDGMQLIVYGEINVYEARGNYQLIVRVVVEDGVGRLQQQFDALKRRLAAEGLFDSARKHPLPQLPGSVAIITSPTGAALQDFLRILKRRDWRGRLIILPAKVQGEGAAREIADMLGHAQEFVQPDLIVVSRGGGSIEDLWAFNEERLVRAVAACTIPIVSAVGHEIDFTLCDFAADIRAETPSAAAELISSGFLAATERTHILRDNLSRFTLNRLSQSAQRLDHARSRLRLLAPSAQVERGFLRLDDLSNRLDQALGQSLRHHRQNLLRLATLLQERTPARRVEIASHQLLALWKRLHAASPDSVLNRGFVILRDSSGRPVQRRSELAPSAEVSAQFADGTARLRAQAD